MKKIELYQEEINIAGHAFLLERVRNVDDLVDQISDELFNEDERLPYWAELWPSALALSPYILEHPAVFENKNILELGCGMGLTSLCLQQTKPKSLTVTDYEQEALASTKQNFKINSIHFPELRLLDWRNPELTQHYDVIVASDVAYEERFFQPLIDLFKTYLTKNGCIIVAEPNRSIARGFFGKLALSGFGFKTDVKTVVQQNKDIKVNIYTIHQNR